MHKTANATELVLAEKVRIPLDAYATQGNAILGIRGAGKSYTGKRVAEVLMDAGFPIVVFDPIGVWRYLKVPSPTHPDPKGYKIVVAGGEAGDLPLTPESAAEIMRAAMAANISIIFDLYSMELSKADWKRIVQTCIRVLLYENKNHGVRHIFIEEGAEFCPQRVGPDQGLVYAEIEKLARMGGNAQLGYTIINQRAEELNKAVLELCDCLILHKQKGRNSLIALEKWLSFSEGDNIARKLPTLSAGECYVWAQDSTQPYFCKIDELRSFHPDRKNRNAISVGKAMDVTEFVGKLGAAIPKLIEEAKRNDPKLLLKRIAELEAGAGVVAAPVDEQYTNELIGQIEALTTQKTAMISQFGECGEQARYIVSQLENILTSTKALSAHTQFVEIASTPQPAYQRPPLARDARVPYKELPPPPAQVPRGFVSDSDTNLPEGEARILNCCLQFNGATRKQLTVLCKFKKSTRNAYVQRLSGRGFVTISGDKVYGTPAGRKALGSAFKPLPTGKALREHWLNDLPDGEAKIFSILCQHYPRYIKREDLDGPCGFEKSTRNAYIQRMNAKEILEFNGGMLRASPELY